MKNDTRYMVFSKAAFMRNRELSSLKNAATRQEARDFKNSKADPSKFAIWDKHSQTVIH